MYCTSTEEYPELNLNFMRKCFTSFREGRTCKQTKKHYYYEYKAVRSKIWSKDHLCKPWCVRDTPDRAYYWACLPSLRVCFEVARRLPLYYKIKIHSSCEIEYFVETHLCKLCVILRSRVLRVVCPREGYRSATPLATTV